MFDRKIIEKQFSHFDGDIDFMYDPDTERAYCKIVGGVCPPNQDAGGYVVIAGLEMPAPGQSPNIWLLGEQGFVELDDMLLAMSRAHHHFKVSTHYARFKRSKTDERVYDDFMRHVQRFNLEAVGQKKAHIVAQDAPWSNHRGHLMFHLHCIL